MIRIFKKYKYVLLILFTLIVGGFVSLYSHNGNTNVSKSPDLKEQNANSKVTDSPSISNNASDYYYVDVKGAVLNPNVYKIDINSRIIDAVNMAGGLTNDADTSVLNLSKKIKDEMNIIIYTKDEIKKIKNLLQKDDEPAVVEVVKEVEKECKCPDPINDACTSENDALIEQDSDNTKATTNTENTTNTNQNAESTQSDNTNETENTNTQDSESNNVEGKININTANQTELMNLPGIGESKANDIITYRNTTRFNTIEDIKKVSGIGDATFAKLKDLITV